MQAGLMRHRVTFQEKTVSSRDTFGGEIKSWGNVGSNPTVWARVEPLRGRELLTARQLIDDVTLRVTVRYRSDVVPEWRVVWDSVSYEILEPPVNVGGLGVELEILCRAAHG